MANYINQQEDEEQENTNQSGVSQQQNQSGTNTQQPVVGGNPQQSTQPQTPVTSANQQVPAQKTQAQAPITQQSNRTNTQQNVGIRQAGQQVASQPAAAPKKAQAGTGYTNLNRIMQANEGNRLSSTLSSGINTNIQNLQSGVQSAQDRFQQEANKNRLDTAENEAKRQSVLDRFDESKYNVDESQFQLNEDLQAEYDQKNADLQNQLETAKATGQGNIANIQSQIDANNRILDVVGRASETAVSKATRALDKQIEDLRNGPQSPGGQTFNINTMGFDIIPSTEDKIRELEKQKNDIIKNNGVLTNNTFDPFAGQIYTNYGVLSGDLLSSDEERGILAQYQRDLYNDHGERETGSYTAANDALQNLLKTYQATQEGQFNEINARLESLGGDFTKLTEAEKAKWIQAEKNRMVAENLPDTAETEAFRKYVQGAYGGPKELGDYQSLLGQAQQTQDLGTLTRLQGGRPELLKQFVGGRDYTAGQRTLDEAILGRSDNSLLSKAAKKALGSEKTVTEANKLASSQAQDLTNKAKAFGEQTRKEIEQARSPLSHMIDQQTQGLHQQEEARNQDVSRLQSILAGTDEGTRGQSSEARLGLALQAAQDAGYFTQGDINDLVSKGGLIDRARKLGLDPNQLINERLQSVGALGIDRRAGATTDQEKRVSALDRLLGKTGTDVEFGTGQEQYQAGKIGLDTRNLADYIAQTEKERIASTPQYMQELEAAGMTPLEQIMSGIGSSLQSGLDLRPEDFAEGVVNANRGILNLNQDVNMKAMHGLNDVLGGNKEIGKLINDYNKIAGSSLDSVQKNALNVISSYDDLKTGKIDQAISKLIGFDTVKNIGGNVSREVSNAISNVFGNTFSNISRGFGAGQTGNWHPSEFTTTDFATGAPTVIGAFANRSSDDILNQLINTQVNRSTIAGNNQGGTQGAKEMNELLKYYYAALEREGK